MKLCTSVNALTFNLKGPASVFSHALFLLSTFTKDRRCTENDLENLEGDLSQSASESGSHILCAKPVSMLHNHWTYTKEWVSVRVCMCMWMNAQPWVYIVILNVLEDLFQTTACVETEGVWRMVLVILMWRKEEQLMIKLSKNFFTMNEHRCHAYLYSLWSRLK